MLEAKAHVCPPLGADASPLPMAVIRVWLEGKFTGRTSSTDSVRSLALQGRIRLTVRGIFFTAIPTEYAPALSKIHRRALRVIMGFLSGERIAK